MSSNDAQGVLQRPTLQVEGEAYTTNPATEALLQWFQEQGGHISDDVRVVHNNSQGFHMRAIRPLTSPVVVTCPLKLTLSCLNLDPEQKEVWHIASCLRPCQGKIPDHILTYLLLIEQRLMGKDSPWHAYITCLPGPDTMATPLWFDEQDMTFLAGTSLAPAAKERKTDYYQQWAQAVTVMKDLGVSLAEQVDFESLLWAATIFTSRAFISTHILPNHETVPVLFPVVDILNHSVSAKVEWDFKPHASFSLKLLEGDSFEPGQELYNNYAPKQNDELLLGYGFCLSNNPIEQFPLKLAFPPMLQDYARATGLFNPENVPFGMSTDFLTKDPNNEQHFLRAKGHPFGRYHNCTPFFQGIPPYIVHFFFIQTLLSLELNVKDINVQKPGANITLQVLTLLHQAISQRSSSLALVLADEPQNDKQTYAKLYRDGQATIIHSVRLELQRAIDRLRKGALRKDAALLTSTEAANTLLSPTQLTKFTSAVANNNLGDNRLIWTTLLACLATYSLMDPESPTAASLRSLFVRHPLPTLEDGIEDAETYSFIDEHLSDFAVSSGQGEDVLQHLDDIGDAYVHDDSVSDPSLLSAQTENLGARVIMWAMRAAEQEVVHVLEDGQSRGCILFQPWHQDGKEEWMYQETV
ncbi:hypothetical protein DE146DRAFT_41279 [Phaeosphaeria sp. MPI-PUGE-AT-0046c]|nr:hypothetical protein DE146DRAFT_41279 [Phaeosphaeria sp. MPI-PUGE-AT-0046c]